MTETYDQKIAAYEKAKRTYSLAMWAWMAAQPKRPRTLEERDALEATYRLDHLEEAAAIEELVSACNIEKAALERRWIEAHEDLAILRKGGLPQVS